jgi:bifunctional DNA-binding transcriptional regulator/antitoxin component of YhaV-PrlF toxin-antitoxin module
VRVHESLTRVRRRSPKEFREKYGIDPGDEVIWIDTGEGLRVVRADNDSGRGMLAEGLDDAERVELAESLTADIRQQQQTGWDV